MKKWVYLILLGMAVMAWGAKQADRPIKGTWSLDPQPVWRVNTVENSPFGKPMAVMILANGNVAVYDPRLKTNFLFDTQGQLLCRFANEGEGPREVRKQNFWYVVKDRLLIPDAGALHVFSDAGQFVETRKMAPMPPPRGFLDADHMVMVPRTLFEMRGERGYFQIVDVKTGSHQNLFEVNALFQGGFANMGEDVMDILVPGLSPMMEVGLGPDFMVYGMSDRYQLTVIDHQGKKRGEFGLDRERRPFNRSQIEGLLKTMNLPADMVPKMAKTFPEALVHFESIEIMDKMIWVQQAEIRPRADRLLFDLFSPQGTYLYQVELKLPAGEFLKSPFKNHMIRGDRLVAVVEEEKGDLAVVCYRITPPQV